VRTVETLLAGRPSLESLAEAGWLGLASLHPGELESTRALAERSGVQAGTRVLDVACGPGETALFLAESFGARVTGTDLAAHMLRRARDAARGRGLELPLVRADALALPFAGASFDVALIECTLALLPKERVLAEMVRVVHSGGGRVGIQDLCWKPGATERARRTLADIEGQRPETPEGWRALFRGAGLVDVEVVPDIASIASWTKASRRRMGLAGQAKVALRVLRRWGPRGLARVLRSERVYASGMVGYALVVGRKR